MELVAFLFQLADWLVFIAPVDDVDTFLQTDVLIIYAVNFVTPYAAGVTLLFQPFCSCIQIADEGVCSRAVFDSQHILCVTIPMLESIPFVIKVEGLTVEDNFIPAQQLVAANVEFGAALFLEEVCIFVDEGGCKRTGRRVGEVDAFVIVVRTAPLLLQVV